MSIFFKKVYFLVFFFTLISTFFISESLSAQEDIHFEHITTKDGLSQNDVNTIYQDKQGFMWFGTHDGLNKYDGYNFTVYNYNQQNKKSINSNLIFTLNGDKNGNLWVGTSGNGINFFNRSTEEFTHFSHDQDNPKSIIDNTIKATLKEIAKLLNDNSGLSLFIVGHTDSDGDLQLNMDLSLKRAEAVVAILNSRFNIYVFLQIFKFSNF